MNRPVIRRLAALPFLLALLATPALAQPREERGAPMGRFDFYVLSLSWSATFCDLTGERRGNPQCEPGRNPGFVVHGLWPQSERGYPAFCTPDGRNPSRNAMDIGERVLPTSGLARHQWRKHGTCSGESPAGYFTATETARNRVRVPKELEAPEAPRRWSVPEIERAFALANPGLRPDMMAVTCKKGMLEEVRLCLTRDLRGFRPCDEVSRDACRTRDIIVPAAR
ncbi:MAG: ribonuclease T2 family protein [Rhabdaerophilum sp.]